MTLFVVADRSSKAISGRELPARLNYRGPASIDFGDHWTILLVLAIVILVIVMLHFKTKYRMGLWLVLLGGASNLIDLVFFDGVVDPIRLSHIAFNIADVMIVVGVCWVIYTLLFEEHAVG